MCSSRAKTFAVKDYRAPPKGWHACTATSHSPSSNPSKSSNSIGGGGGGADSGSGSGSGSGSAIPLASAACSASWVSRHESLSGSSHTRAQPTGVGNQEADQGSHVSICPTVQAAMRTRRSCRGLKGSFTCKLSEGEKRSPPRSRFPVRHRRRRRHAPRMAWYCRHRTASTSAAPGARPHPPVSGQLNAVKGLLRALRPSTQMMPSCMLMLIRGARSCPQTSDETAYEQPQR